LLLRREVVELDPARHRLWDERGIEHVYERLLLATGGKPRRLVVSGAEVEGVHYSRSLEDYLHLESRLDRFEHVLVVGGGFVGAELAAALRHAGKEVTFLYDREYPLFRVLSRELGMFVADYYRQQGVETVSEDKVVGFEAAQGLIHVRLASGSSISTQTVLVGIGIEPEVDLAEAAGLDVDDGIVVDGCARTTDPDIFAAGDVTRFPCVALQRSLHVEHWGQHGRGRAGLRGHPPFLFGPVRPGLRGRRRSGSHAAHRGSVARADARRRRLLSAGRRGARGVAVECAGRRGLGARPGARGEAHVGRGARSGHPATGGGGEAVEGWVGCSTRGPATVKFCRGTAEHILGFLILADTTTVLPERPPRSAARHG
jgi:thioredoxin reductase